MDDEPIIRLWVGNAHVFGIVIALALGMAGDMKWPLRTETGRWTFLALLTDARRTLLRRWQICLSLVVTLALVLTMIDLAMALISRSFATAEEANRFLATFSWPFDLATAASGAWAVVVFHCFAKSRYQTPQFLVRLLGGAILLPLIIYIYAEIELDLLARLSYSVSYWLNGKPQLRLMGAPMPETALNLIGGAILVGIGPFLATAMFPLVSLTLGRRLPTFTPMRRYLRAGLSVAMALWALNGLFRLIQGGLYRIGRPNFFTSEAAAYNLNAINTFGFEIAWLPSVAVTFATYAALNAFFLTALIVILRGLDLLPGCAPAKTPPG